MPLKIMKNAYDETKYLYYNTATFDFEHATAPLHYNNPAIAEATFTPTQSTIKSIRFNITQAGMEFLSGYTTNINARENIIKPMRYMTEVRGGITYCDVEGVQAVELDRGIRPEDWYATYKYKYYVRTAKAYPSINAPTHILYTYTTIDEFDSNADYYTLPDDVSTAIFYTQRGSFFGVQRLLGNADATSTHEQLGLITRAQGIWSDSLWYRENGAFGNLLFRPASGTGYGNVAYQGSRAYSVPIENIVAWYPNSIVQFITFEYGTGETKDTYYGVAHIFFSTDGIPMGANVCAVSEDFWIKPESDVYAGPKSRAAGGHGRYIASDERKGVRGPLSSYKISVAPGVMGWKVCKTSMTGIANIQSRYITHLRDTSTTPIWTLTNPSDVLSVMNSSILSVYKVPLEPVADDEITQWQFAGDTFNTDADIGYGINRYEYQDFGSVNLGEGWYDSYLDYDPYTKAYIYLPFIGDFELPVSDIMYGKLTLEYYQDNINGDLLARLTCMNYNFPIPYIKESALSPYEHLIGQFVGNGLMQYPISAEMSSTVFGIGQIAKAFLGGGAGQAIGNGLRKGINDLGAALDKNHIKPGDFEPLTGTPLGKLEAGVQQATNAAAATAPLVKGTLAALDTISQLNLQPAAQSLMGEYRGNSGYMSDPQPYIKIVKTLYVEPDNQEEEKGYPANITYNLRKLPAGSFNVCSSNVNFKEIPNCRMTKTEREMILDILNSGFYR